MPKIPHQAQRTVLPSGGTGTGASANARQIAGKVTGIQAFGAALTGGAEQLGAAFQHAAHERDKIEAHMRSLEAQTGSQTISLVAQAKMDADMEELTEQVRKQGGSNPEGWQVKGKDANGEETLFAPNDGAEAAITSTYSNALKQARESYGAEGEAKVATELQNHALRNLSKFRSDHLKLRYDKLTADVDTNAQFYADRAADITRPEDLRKSDIKTMDGLLDSAVRKGALTQEEANKRQTTLHADIADKYYSAEAAARPLKFLEDSAGWMKTTESEEGATRGAISVTKGGETQQLPEGLDPRKLQHYQTIALGKLAQEQATAERAEKRHEKLTKETHEANQVKGMATILAGESMADKLPTLVANGDMKPEDANNLRLAEHSIKTQNANDPVLIRQSALSRIDFSRSITNAMFGEGDLETLAKQITEDVKGGRMRPTDVEPLMTEMRTARTHLASEESQKRNERMQNEKAYIREILTAKGPLNQWDRIADDAKAEASHDFLFHMQKDPTQDPRKIRDEVLKVWAPVVEERKNILGETPDKVKFDDAKLQSMVKNKAMTPAGAKAIRERQENEKGRKIVSDYLSTYKPPDPSWWEKAKSFSEQAAQAGSSLFKDESTEAIP